MSKGWDSTITEFDGDILITIKHKGMKKFKIFRAYHVDSDELVIELKEYGKDKSNGRRNTR